MRGMYEFTVADDVMPMLGKIVGEIRDNGHVSFASHSRITGDIAAKRIENACRDAGYKVIWRYESMPAVDVYLAAVGNDGPWVDDLMIHECVRWAGCGPSITPA